MEAVRLEHRHLRGAIEFALARAEADRRARPPISPPSAFRPYFGAPRVPTGKLGGLRRVVETDEAFRTRLVAALDDGAPGAEQVGPIGELWLRRPDGWVERLVEVVAETEQLETERERAAELESALLRERRRRESVEDHLARERSKLATIDERVERLTAELDELRAELAEVTVERDELREQLVTARTEVRHANDRTAAANARIARLKDDRDDASARAVAAEGTRDAVLARRAERTGDEAALAAAAVAARRLAEQLTALTAAVEGSAGPAEHHDRGDRTPLRLPGGVVGDSEAAAEFLLRSGAVVLVDGYNVSMLGWPDRPLVDQRRALVEMAENLARRYGTDIAVVFDGAEVVGAASDQRRIVRVVFSPPDVIADDVIRAEVARLPPDRPVVVVTNDAEIVRDVRSAGANPLASESFLEIGRR